MNGLLDAMFNLQWFEISIYQRHNDGEPERGRKKGSEKREWSEERGFPFPLLFYLMN